MYEFDERHAYEFANFVHANAKLKGNELTFRKCPYCNPTEKRDNLGTFSINLKTGQFKCLRASCGVSGNMITLAKDFDFSLGTQIDEYYAPKKQYRKLTTPEKPIVPRSNAITYLESRGISKLVAEKYEITTQKDKQNILVFPFFDEKGKIQFVKYRKTDFDKSKDANKEWCEANCKPILFGMKQCEDFTTLVITEGQIDSLSVATAGIKNVVSVPTGANGFTWLPYCWNWINSFEEVIVFGDYEKGKITLLDELSKRLKVFVKHVREEDYKDCKDANEILKKYGTSQIITCINNAVRLPMKNIIDLSEVQDENPYLVEKLPTGISDFDKVLYGGLPFGGLTIVAGKRGEGKSTLSSQILINAIENNYTCFAYSGELPNKAFRSIIDFQAAGSMHITEVTNENGTKYNKVSNTNKNLISNWYKGKCFLYDNSFLEDDETESLIDTVKNVIMQYGVRVILLDNLMTAIDLEDSSTTDKNEKQSLFVKKLARMALKYNVLIILVAHKRKNNFSTDENDEISGSGDISNLASVIVSYERDSKLEQFQRIGKITKSRLFGKLELNGVSLDYDFKSKRIYGSNDDVNREYSWNVREDGFYKNEDGETPFD